MNGKRSLVWVSLVTLSGTVAVLGSGCSGDSGSEDDMATGGTSPEGGAPGGGTGGETASGGSASGGLGGADGIGGLGGEDGSGGSIGDGCSVIGPEVQAHIKEMAEEGWAARNIDNELEMYGCVGAEAARDCLSEKPDAADTLYGADWSSDLPGSTIRVLRVNSSASRYFTRSSPDGRFVAYGVTAGAAEVFDLQRDVAVAVAAQYDPGFFPDGSGWIIQAGGTVCAESVLTDAPSAVTLNEAGCDGINEIGLNQSVGAVPGGDYWAIDGTFNADDGGKVPTLSDPEAAYGPSAKLDLTTLIFDGTTFQASDAASLATPDQGNFALSPSGKLMLSRLGSPDDAEQHGYRLSSLAWNDEHSGLESAELAHYCVNGGDAVFSYDERWVVFHHYVEASDATELGFDGPEDPAFADYLDQGAANVYLLDLASGLRSRVTRSSPGQYALFPHFRSDGWIYFVVRTAGSTTEYIVASDAALDAE